MKQFMFTAKGVFFAEDIDDVFRKMEEHFRGLREGSDEDNTEFVGEMHIEPLITEQEVIRMPCKGGKKKGGKKKGK